MDKYKDFDLKKLKTVVLHNRSEHRKNHMNTLLDSLGLDYTLYDCIIHENNIYSGILTINKILLELDQQEIFEPFLFLEDDVNITDSFSSIISTPVDADCVYLGLSECFSNDVINYYQHSPSRKWTIIDEKLVKIADMLSTHAFVVTSKIYLSELLSIFKELLINPTHYDIPVARIQHKFNVYGFKNPLFYQYGHVGGQEGATKITLDKIYDRVMK